MNTVDVIGPSTQLAAGTDGLAIAVCPSGTVVTGGGYFAGGSTVIIMHTTAPNNWLVEAIAGPTSTTLTAIAKCASIHQGGRRPDTYLRIRSRKILAHAQNNI